jgi:ferrous iron transport protein B
MKLSDLKIGDSAYIVQVNGDEAFARRLSEIGFIRGEKIYNHMKAPLMDPVEYEIMGSTITLRRSETKFIEISTDPVEKVACPSVISSLISEEAREDEKEQATNQTSCGCNEKETSGCECGCSHNKEGDITAKKTSETSESKENGDVALDIEGASPEEIDEATPNYCKFCPEQKDCDKKKEQVKTNLRNRKWNGQRIKVVLVGNPNCGKTTLFNHISGGHEKEGNYCGVTVDSKEGTFIHNGVKVHLIDLPGTYSLASYSPEEKYVEDYLKNNEVDVILNVLDANNLERNLYLTLQCQKNGIPMVGALNMFDELEKRGDSIDCDELSKRLGMKFMTTTSKYGKGLKQLFDEVLAVKGTTPKFTKQAEVLDTNNTGECFAFIQQVLEGIYTKSKDGKSKFTARVDAIVTNRWLGFIVFILLLYLMFKITFDWIGNPIMDYVIEPFFNWIGELVGELLPDGWFKDLIVDGIIGGVGGVIIFLPNILLLFICVSVMEESGYMARAAFILDRIMRVFGLHGKSFIPMIIGFGCNVPAIMSTRGIENRKNRLVTILVASLFSCSARTPIYNVFAGAFFPDHVSLVIASVYAVGIIIALILAKLFSLFLVKEQEMNYLMELPEYRLPSVRNVLKHTWERGKQYLKKMGTVILFASILIWVLSNFPRVEEGEEINQNEKSCLGHIGKFVEPVFKPMGANWQMDVGLLTGFSAKEVVVATLNILYDGEEDAEEEEATLNLSEKLKASGVNSRAAYAYMLFCLLYFPCIATIAAVGHEAGYKWAAITAVYTTVLAWIVSTLFYQVSGLF